MDQHYNDPDHRVFQDSNNKYLLDYTILTGTKEHHCGKSRKGKSKHTLVREGE